MLVEQHPNDLRVEHPATQECLDYACAVGRWTCGWDTPKGLQPLPKKPHVQTMAEIKEKAVIDAVGKFHGNVEAAAHWLAVGRGTIYNILKRHGMPHRSYNQSNKVIQLSNVA